MKVSKVIFYPGWEESVSDYTQRISRQTPDNRAKWKSIEATDNSSFADFAICQDHPISLHKALNEGFTKNQIIYIKRESDYALPIIKEGFGICYQGKCNIIPSIWWISTNFSELVKESYPSKEKNLSAIVSNMNILEGHKKRLKFINNVSANIKIDVFGRGHSEESFNLQYKGEIKSPNRCKLIGLNKYYYSLAIENASLNGYITEKFNDCILSWTKPLYYGAPNINQYFPEKSFCLINNHVNESNINGIQEIVESRISLEDIDAISEARERILFTYNLWNISEMLVRKIRD